MSKPAALPLFGDSYLADTTHLTTEEHGAYLLLMIAAWRQPECSLPLDDRKLARIAGLSAKKWTSIRETILEFWTVENDRIYQARLRKEHVYVCQKSEANRKSAEARWNKQPIEKQQYDECERITERNAPPPPPIRDKEPNGSSSRRADAPTKPKRQSGDFDVEAVSLPADIPSDEWSAFVAMRRAIKKPIKTQFGVDGLISELRRLAEDGHPPGAVLKQSVNFEYQGVFPLKTGRTNNGNGNHHNQPDEPHGLEKAIAARRASEASEQPEFL